MSVPTKIAIPDDIAIEQALIEGDLSALTPAQRVTYYNRVCKDLDLLPSTQPFDYIKLQGKLKLYPLRTCSDQLRNKRNVSLEIVSREIANDILTVHVRAKMPNGRIDEDIGAVPFPAFLKGEARSNAEMKAITKAKRRCTLSICGLGWPDESEIDSIPGAEKFKDPAPNVMKPLPGQSSDPVQGSAPAPGVDDHGAEPEDLGPDEQFFDGIVAQPSQPATIEAGAASRSGPVVAAPANIPTAQEYYDRWMVMLDEASNPAQLGKQWNNEKPTRDQINWPEGMFPKLKKLVVGHIQALK